MLHLDSSNKLPDSHTQQPTGSLHNEPSVPIKKKQKILQLNSLQDLSFEKFLFTDMRKFDAQVVHIEHGVFIAAVHYHYHKEFSKLFY